MNRELQLPHRSSQENALRAVRSSCSLSRAALVVGFLASPQMSLKPDFLPVVEGLAWGLCQRLTLDPCLGISSEHPLGTFHLWKKKKKSGPKWGIFLGGLAVCRCFGRFNCGFGGVAVPE